MGGSGGGPWGHGPSETIVFPIASNCINHECPPKASSGSYPAANCILAP